MRPAQSDSFLRCLNREETHFSMEFHCWTSRETPLVMLKNQNRIRDQTSAEPKPDEIKRDLVNVADRSMRNELVLLVFVVPSSMVLIKDRFRQIIVHNQNRRQTKHWIDDRVLRPN